MDGMDDLLCSAGSPGQMHNLFATYDKSRSTSEGLARAVKTPGR